MILRYGSKSFEDEKKREMCEQGSSVNHATAMYMAAVAAPAFAQADLAESLVNAKFLSTDAASSTMCSSRGFARSSDTRKGSKPEHASVSSPLHLTLHCLKQNYDELNLQCAVDL